MNAPFAHLRAAMSRQSGTRVRVDRVHVDQACEWRDWAVDEIEALHRMFRAYDAVTAIVLVVCAALAFLAGELIR